MEQHSDYHTVTMIDTTMVGILSDVNSTFQESSKIITSEIIDGEYKESWGITGPILHTYGAVIIPG